MTGRRIERTVTTWIALQLLCALLALGCNETTTSVDAGSVDLQRADAAPETDAPPPAPDSAVDGPRADLAPQDPDLGTVDLGPGVACTGDYYVKTAAELAQVAKCTSINGSLDIRTSGVQHVALPLLQSVTKDFTVTLTDALSVKAPALASVGGECRITDNYTMAFLDIGALAHVKDLFWILRNSKLLKLELPLLQQVVGALLINDNKSLTAVNLAALKQAGSSLDITSNDALTSINNLVVETVGGHMTISQNAAMTTLKLAALKSVSSFLHIKSNSTLTSVELGLLKTVGNTLVIDGNPKLTSASLPALTVSTTLSIVTNAALASFSLPALATVKGALSVDNNTTLAQFNLDSLLTAGPVSFMNDPKLGKCLTTALKGRMQSYTAFTVYGLDDSCTCLPDAKGTPVATCP